MDSDNLSILDANSQNPPSQDGDKDENVSDELKYELEGVRDELICSLDNFGIERFEPSVGDVGDPSICEITGTKTSDNDGQHGLIAEVNLVGYKYTISDESPEKIIRHAKVVTYKENEK